MTTKATITGMKARFTMSLKGGKLPSDFVAKIPTTIDYTGVSNQTLMEICSGGQSARVMLQSQLRNRRVPELMKMANEGLVVKIADILKGSTQAPADLLLALSLEDFVTELGKLGVDKFNAEAIYRKKHGLDEEVDEDDQDEEEEETETEEEETEE